MSFRAYYAPSGRLRIPPLDRERWPRAEFVDLDQALAWAESVAGRGKTVLAIEGDDGTQLTISEIAAALGANSRRISRSD